MYSDSLPTDIITFHQRTKHAPTRYALGPAFLDWTSQPSPYRRFEGAPLIELPLRREATAVFPGPAAQAASLNHESLGLFLELAFGLSAWKSVEGSTWALRNNPSSGNLHPTEAYLLMNAGDNDKACLFHYAPQEHALEQRAIYETSSVAPPGGFLLALTSIPWREAWKYGERAFRYCQLDAGHAIGAAAQAAAANGWRAHMFTAPSDDELARLIGLDRSDAFHRREEEHPDLLLWISTDGARPDLDLADILQKKRAFAGVANRLSEDHDGWPAVDYAVRFCHKQRMDESAPVAEHPAPSFDGPSIAEVVRARRSAQRMDGVATLPRENFARMLAATLPGAAPLMAAFPMEPRVALALFVHRVDGVEPGFYLLPRNTTGLRGALSPEFDWTPIELDGVQLFQLRAGAHEKQATQMSCLQPIAGKSCFAGAMIADFDRTLIEEGGFAYRRLHWEAGLIGQALYLWATAVGLGGTGIGCFFDDEVHELLGLTKGDMQFQDVYHFTVGGPVEDTRILTLPAYPEERWGQPFGGSQSIPATR